MSTTIVKKETAIAERKESPTDTIDLTIDSDDEDMEEDLKDFVRDLELVRIDLDCNLNKMVLKMFVMKHVEGKEVLDHFINWAERNEITSKTMMKVADLLDVKYEDYGGQMVWEEKMM